MRVHIFHGILFSALTLSVGFAQKESPVNGDWKAEVAGESYSFSFTEDQGDVDGTVQLPDGETIEIEFGLVLGKELEFTTIEETVEFEWTAELTRNSLKGERMNLENDSVVRFSAKKVR